MKKSEILGLIIMVYSDNCKYEGITIEDRERPVFFVTHNCSSYLTRKGYFDKRTQRPTLKLYKLLHKNNVKIKQLEQWQKEYAETGHVTQYNI